MKDKQGFLRYPGRTLVNKLVQENRICLATWNVGMFIDKSMELVDTKRYRRINIVCLQETKLKGEKTKEIDGYKLRYTGKDNNRNGIGILVDKYLKNKVVNIKRISDRLLLIKLVLRRDN
ncbi:hypothetical protein AMTRI_Chr02g257610 [Amborella trichopoda]